jgi:hypothetical protein
MLEPSRFFMLKHPTSAVENLQHLSVLDPCGRRSPPPHSPGKRLIPGLGQSVARVVLSRVGENFPWGGCVIPVATILSVFAKTARGNHGLD